MATFPAGAPASPCAANRERGSVLPLAMIAIVFVLATGLTALRTGSRDAAFGRAELAAERAYWSAEAAVVYASVCYKKGLEMEACIKSLGRAGDLLEAGQGYSLELGSGAEPDTWAVRATGWWTDPAGSRQGLRVLKGVVFKEAGGRVRYRLVT